MAEGKGSGVSLVTLVVPQAEIEGLRLPSRSLADGSEDPEWVDFPLAGSGRAVLPIPLDSVVAARARRWMRGQRWGRAVAMPVLLVAFAAVVAGYAISGFTLWTSILSLMFSIAALASQLWNRWWDRARAIPQAPVRTRGGEFRIKAVDSDVAHEVVAMHPEISIEQPSAGN